MTASDQSTTSPTTAPVHDLRETVEERSAAGKAARKRAPRGAFARWDETTRGHDALDTIVAQNAIRVPELLPSGFPNCSPSDTAAWWHRRGTTTAAPPR